MVKFQLAGIPIEIRTDFLIGTVIFAMSRLSQPLLLAEWIVVVAVSILVHELGHAFAFRAFGHQPRVMMYAMGGLTFGSPGVALTPWRDIAVSLAGPIAGLLFGGLVVALTSVWPPEPRSILVQSTIDDLKWVNIGWGLVNLLPILPLDGGRVMQSLLRLRMSVFRADRAAAVVTIAVASIAALWALSVGLTLAALLAGMSVFAAVQTLRASPGGALGEALSTAREALARGDLARAEALATQAGESAHARELVAEVQLAAGRPRDARATLDALGIERVRPALAGAVLLECGEVGRGIELLSVAATTAPDEAVGQRLVRALVQAGQHDRARELLMRTEGRALGDVAHGMAEAGLFHAGRWSDALALSARRFERFRSADAAYNAACSAAKLERVDEGLTWLGRAVDVGYADAAHARADPDLEPLRRDARWEGLVARMGYSA